MAPHRHRRDDARAGTRVAAHARHRRARSAGGGGTVSCGRRAWGPALPEHDRGGAGLSWLPRGRAISLLGPVQRDWHRGFTWYIENSVRDAEWALNEIHSASARRPSARERDRPRRRRHDRDAVCDAEQERRRLVNIDSGNFSTRSEARALAFYDPRFMRVPYLFIATAETRKTQDLFDQFKAMTFSERFEVILDGSEIRHHDLSDYGRAVTAPMAIRGAPQADVQQRFVDVQEMAVRFLLERSGRPADGLRFTDWLKAQTAARYAVTVYPGSRPGPHGRTRAGDPGRQYRRPRCGREASRPGRAAVPGSRIWRRVISKALVVREFRYGDRAGRLRARGAPQRAGRSRVEKSGARRSAVTWQALPAPPPRARR